MSTMEIILYSAVGGLFIIWLIMKIIDIKKGKNPKKKNETTEEDE